MSQGHKYFLTGDRHYSQNFRQVTGTMHIMSCIINEEIGFIFLWFYVNIFTNYSSVLIFLKRKCNKQIRMEMLKMLKKEETALIVVDMQYGGGAPDGSLVQMLNVDVTKQEDIVTPIVQLKDFFHENDMLVVNVKTEYEVDFSDWEMLAERFEVEKYKHFVKGSTDAEIIPPLAPREGEELVIKNRWNAFFNTNLDAILKENKVRNIVVVGAATDVCVLETCSNAFYLNYNCIVPMETTASFNQERKKIGLEVLRFGRSEVVHVEDVYNMFELSKDESTLTSS